MTQPPIPPDAAAGPAPQSAFQEAVERARAAQAAAPPSGLHEGIQQATALRFQVGAAALPAAGRWLRLAWRPALLVAALVGAGLALRRLGLDGAVARAGEAGPLAFAGLGTLACAIGVPRQAVAYAGGLAFGFWPGGALALVAEILGCACDFFAVRLLGRRWAERWLQGRAEGRLGRLDRFLAARAFTATLTLRLLPVGSNIALNLLAGVTGVAAGPFLLASLIGYVPQTAVFALLGGGVRVSQGAQVALAAALFAVSIALGVLLLRRRPAPL